MGKNMKNRVQIILSVAVILLVVGGTLLLSSYSYNHLIQELSEQIVSDNKIIGEQVLELLEEQQLSTRSEADQQKLLQSICEKLELPNGGFICATDNSGKLLAVKGYDASKNMSLGSAALKGIDGKPQRTISNTGSQEEFSGYLNRMGTIDVVASFPIPNTMSRLLVHQNIDILKENVRGYVLPMLYAGFAASLLMGFITYFATGSIISSYESKLEDKNRELTRSNMEIFSTINELAEMRDNETGMHIVRVSKFSRMLAEHIGEAPQFCKDIEQFAPLHDIGKVGIPDAVLLAERKLTDNEFKIIKRHPYLGYKILNEKYSMAMGADIAYGHHEKFDGSGYPQGISGENIPLVARIVSIADVYDALRSKRPYKEPWPHEKSVRTIKEDAGTAFDPRLVEAFLEVEPEFARISDELRD